jgi:cyclopropane fatty-acyl-phospholipid synthase-like methyltransferase
MRYDNKFDFILDRGCFHHISADLRIDFIKNIDKALKPGGKYLLMAFSERNGFEKSLTKEQLHAYFGKYFYLGEIKETVHQEPDNNKVYLYTTLMASRVAI